MPVRLPADCLHRAGLQEGDHIEIVVGEDGPMNFKPLRQLDRSALAAELRWLQATMQLTPAVMEQCRVAVRW